MSARILDGVAVANQIHTELRPVLERFAARSGRPPGLGIVLAGENPASEIYVRNKLKSAGDAGLRADLIRLPATAAISEVLDAIDRLNRSDAHDGIIVQTPLPAAMGAGAERRVFDAIRPDKDVDGFHPVNVGRLVQNRATLVACTPLGVIELLDRSNIAIDGTRAVVVGASDIVGKPMALLLLHRHATITVCHVRTADLAKVTSEADILVVAIGRPGLVTEKFIKPGSTVIDVGMNQLSDRAAVERVFSPGSKKWEAFERRGSVIVGDVHPSVSEVAGALTPVPGGVGPLTIAMLLKNTVTAAQERAG